MTDKYDISAKIGIRELDNFAGKMSAKDQRYIFGKNIFGKKTIKIDNTGQGRVTGSFKVAFGHDWSSFRFSFEQIADAVNSGKELSF